MNHNYYEILEVSPNASTDVIEAVYKRLAKKYHPDLQKEIKRVSAEDKMKELNLAYETLKDPCSRKQYDAFLMKARSNSNNKSGLSTAGRMQIIKAKVEKSLNTTMNYRHLLTVALILIFGITVLIIGLNTYNEPRIDITENLGYHNELSPEEIVINKNDPVVPEDRFTLGSSQAVVKKVMGAPTSMFIYSWSYGASLIYFDKEGKVDGWAKIDKSLKAWLGYKQKNAPPFKVGSTKDEVIKAMGTPSSVFGSSWSFGKSTVCFDENERVKSWVEIDKTLRAGTK